MLCVPHNQWNKAMCTDWLVNGRGNFRCDSQGGLLWGGDMRVTSRAGGDWGVAEQWVQRHWGRDDRAWPRAYPRRWAPWTFLEVGSGHLRRCLYALYSLVMRQKHEFDSWVHGPGFCVPTWPWTFTWAASLVQRQLGSTSWATFALRGCVHEEETQGAEKASSTVTRSGSRSQPLLLMEDTFFSPSLHLGFPMEIDRRWRGPSQEGNTMNGEDTKQLTHQM